MNKSESIKELATALAKAQREIEPALMDSTNPHFKSRFASLGSVIGTIKEPLANYGLSYIQTLSSESEGVCLQTMLMHTSGEWISDQFKLLIDKANMQGLGSAVTYGRRYALSALLGIIADEDDDGNTAVRFAPKAKNFAPQSAKLIEAGRYICPVGVEAKGKELSKLPLNMLVRMVTFLDEKKDANPTELEAKMKIKEFLELASYQ